MAKPDAPTTRIRLLGLFLLAAAVPGVARAQPSPGAAPPAVPGPSTAGGRVYVGTYTGGPSGSKGIYVFELNPNDLKSTPPRLAAETPSPSFLAVAPDGRCVYAVNEVESFGGKKGGGVSAFAVDAASGALSALNDGTSGGGSPCHISLDKAGRNALVANYGGGSVAVLPIASDGHFGEVSSFVQHEGSGGDPARQKGPHAHSINLDPANAFAFVADLGLDKVLVYKFNPTAGTLTANDPPAAKVAPGAGPRHFAFRPDGKFAYVINELNSTVTAFAYDPASGTLKEVETVSTLPKGFVGKNYPADVQVHPSGKFLFGSNRGHDSIVVYAIDPQSGKLAYVENEGEGVKNPRNFGIDPTGSLMLVANQDLDTIAVFRIDPATGALSPTRQTIRVPKPVCVKFWNPAP